MDMSNQKFCILFAGAPGSSKSPIAMYLSGKLGLPVFNNDVIRTEVLEDLGVYAQEEHLKRRNERLMDMLDHELSFIVDASADRGWKQEGEYLLSRGYIVFIISLDLSKNFLQHLYELKGYHESAKQLDTFMAEHEAFLKEYGEAIGLHIIDASFPDRLTRSLQAVLAWQETLG
jgi:hypothetical protein